jgi:hypothetical protein
VGTLTPFLQREFKRHAPPGWECSSEESLLPDELTSLLGYRPRADVVLSDPSSQSRIWIEFEVSRADPVANHAKFATAHLYAPQPPSDHFVSMISPHVDRGRRNLAAATVRLMRWIGMSAFQTTLLPLTTPEQIQGLNHLSAEALQTEVIDVGEEINRLLAVVTPVGRWGRLAVHLVGDILDVLLNLRGWNDDIRTPEGQRRWGRRAVTYLVFDSASGLFAPAKFCAYAPVHSILIGGNEATSNSTRMSIAAYADLNDGTHVMDGHRAQRHLSCALGMRPPSEAETSLVTAAFGAWCQAHQEFVTVKNDAPMLLLPPTWYAGLAS